MDSNTFQNLINAVNKPHAILFIENNLSNTNFVISSYLKSILCKNNKKGFCDTCEWCKKINNNNYFDLIVIDCHKNGIKKNDILEIKNKFLMSALEKRGIKIYIIKGIELANQSVANALLKFIEEPPQNTYCIMTTRNINKVIPTVVSRVFMYRVSSSTNINYLLDNYKLNSMQKKIIKSIYYDIEEIENDLKNNLFFDLYNLAIFFMNVNYKNIKTSLEFFKNENNENIKKIIRILMQMSENNKEKYLRVMSDIEFNPNKVLLFNKLIEISERKQ